jgi:Flp pilus assembly pilin Flp
MRRTRRGATAIEYGLLVGLVALAMLGAVGVMGGALVLPS